MLAECVDNYLACLAVTKKSKHRKLINEFLSNLHSNGYQKAGKAFEAKNYDTSMVYYLAIAHSFEVLDVFDPDVYFYSGASAYYLGYTREAFEQVSTFLALRPDDFKGNYGIGILYYDQAENLHNMLTAISDPEMIAENKLKRNETIAKAHFHLKKAKSINPDHENIDQALKTIEEFKADLEE